MKRYCFLILFGLMTFACVNVVKAKAYSVSVKGDSMYADFISDDFMEHVSGLFRKHVKKSMKYYDKYKNADMYTYMKKIPNHDDASSRDFIDIAKQIQDEDEIVLHFPFYIYCPDEKGDYGFWFIAERNHKKLCMFEVCLSEEKGKYIFSYDKQMDHYFSYDEKKMQETLFYMAADKNYRYRYYAQTPDESRIARDLTDDGMIQMEGSGRDTREAVQFIRKSYQEKKEEIFSYLGQMKNGKAVEKAEENLKIWSKKNGQSTGNLSEKKEEAEHGKKMPFIKLLLFWGTGMVCIVGIVILERRKMRGKEKS